ncbi:MAG TPA: phenylacetate--CoA ligase [Candidatus Binatia bacterium]|nr:phenylacetate--CoA ligase [Candidatus Binatia bacterium]
MIWDPAAETQDPGKRAALQLARVRQTVAWAAARVPFYRERLAGVEVRSLEDLARLPFTRKSDLRDHYPFGLLAVPREDLVRVHASSGTRGKPTVVGYTAEDLEVWREVMARVMTAAGARRGDLLHIAFGYGLFTGGLGFHQGAERLGLTVVPASSGQTVRQCLLLRDLQPAGLCATPSFALHIAETLAAEGVPPAGLGLRYGMFGAEPWTEAMRRAIEAGLGLRAYDIYGLSEIVGPGVSGECEAREGLHVADDHFLPEVVDPASGEPLDAGRPGELVLTTLTKRGLPLIRYRTGDITALEPAPCRCGRTSVRMHRLIGRADDMLVIKGVNVYPSEVEAALLGLPELAPHYLLVVDRRAALARIEVQVEPTAGFLARVGGLDDGHPEVAALRTRVAGGFQAALGLAVEVRVMPPGALPRSEGKAVRVVERT